MNESAKSDPWSSPRLIALVLVALTLALYGPAAGFSATNCDDTDYFTVNRHIRTGLTWDNLTWAMTAFYASNWHPLTWISLMVDSSISGNQPWSAHTTNLLLHALNAGLLYLVLRRLTGAHWRSALVAALFAAHPTHVESVAWIAERKDVLSTFFGLLTLWFYAKWTAEKSEKHDRTYDRTYWLAVGMFALSLLSKSMLVTLPCLLLLLDFWPLRRLGGATSGKPDWRPLLREKIPFFVLTGVSCILTFLAQRAGGAVSELSDLSLTARLENAVVAYARYVGKLLWPEDLTIMYLHHGTWPWTVVAGAGLLLVVGCWGAMAWRHRRPYVFTGWFWFLGTLVPVIGLVQVGMQSIADRYTYVPSIGFFLIVAWAMGECAEHRPAWKRWLVVPAIGAVLMFGWLTARQLPRWQNTETVFRHALAVTKGNFFAHNNLGCELRDLHCYRAATAQFEAALKIFPKNAHVLNNYGYLYAMQNKYAEALPYYEAALKLKPDHRSARENLASALFMLDRPNESRDQYLEIIRREADQAETHNLLGVVLASTGKFEESLPHFQTALWMNPDLAAAHCNLANVMVAGKLYDNAIREYREAIRLDPAYAEAVNNLAGVLALQGAVAEAIGWYRQALFLEPSSPQAHFHIGRLLLQSGRRDAGLRNLQEALRLKPDYDQARKKLAELGVTAAPAAKSPQ